MKSEGKFSVRRDCRLCGKPGMVKLFAFGKTALANAYLTKRDLTEEECMVPLTVQRCLFCNSVQLRETVHPDLLFRRYLYVSGTSPVFVRHFETYAERIAKRFSLGERDLVVDVGSNDGVLLSAFRKAGTKILGIDPAKNIAAQANKNGIPTLAEFFGVKTARKISKQYGKARVITANNVFAHTDDLTGFVEGVKEVLAPDGVFVFEVQYLKNLIEGNLFDMIYHEHIFYHHLTPLVPFFERLGLRVFDVEVVPTHGGSLRVFVEWKHGPYRTSKQVAAVLSAEHYLNRAKTYRDFEKRILQSGEKLRKLFASIRRSGGTIVGYGAPAKATTLCAAFGISGKMLAHIVDDAPLKQGLFMPGTHIPIRAPEALYEERPDYCLILAWNFADSIAKKHASFGGRFISPFPKPRILP